MKKLLRTLLLAAALTALLCVSALAADSTVSNVKGGILPLDDSGKQITAEGGKYTGAVQFDLTATEGLTNGSQYLVLMLKDAGENTVPTAENIYYINQKAAAADGKLTFTNAGGDSVYPMDLVNGTYSIYIVGEGKNFNAAKADASFTYDAGYIKGDANGDGKVNIDDVTAVLNHVVENRFLTGTNFEAADVVKDDKINIDDVTKLLNFIVENITTLD